MLFFPRLLLKVCFTEVCFTEVSVFFCLFASEAKETTDSQRFKGVATLTFKKKKGSSYNKLNKIAHTGNQ